MGEKKKRKKRLRSSSARQVNILYRARRLVTNSLPAVKYSVTSVVSARLPHGHFFSNCVNRVCVYVFPLKTKILNYLCIDPRFDLVLGNKTPFGRFQVGFNFTFFLRCDVFAFDSTVFHARNKRALCAECT